MMNRNRADGKAMTLIVAGSLLAMTAIWMGMVSVPVTAQQNKPTVEDLRTGKNFIETKVYSLEASSSITTWHENAPTTTVVSRNYNSPYPCSTSATRCWCQIPGGSSSRPTTACPRQRPTVRWPASSDIT